VVVDCSVLAAILFDEPGRDRARAVLTGKGLYAPWLIDYEMSSVAVKKANSGFSDVADQGMDDLASLRLIRCSTDVQAQFRLAIANALSAYDAAYLQLAIELNAPLVTYDQALGRVAERVLKST
jgi:predicted nucleic acid-binding protein